MKRYLKHIITVFLLLMAWNLSAQNVQQIYQMPQKKRTYLINWMPESTEGQRWTVALRPIYLAQNGLKVDFEFELAKPGNWIRLELAGHKRRQFTDNDYREGWWFSRDGWSHHASSYDNYKKLQGAGAGIGFKSMWSPRGWYYNAQLTFNYFRVSYDALTFQEFQDEDGQKMWERAWRQDSSDYYKPELTFNVGKHFPMGPRAFLDGYVGLGYAWNFSNNRRPGYYEGSSYSFGGEGLFFNAGFRIGVLLGPRARQ